MTYWNMRAYSDGGEMRPNADRAATGGPKHTRGQDCGWVESDGKTEIGAGVASAPREGR
jgi:hypothetical protein